jgi:hypothetical protein
MMVISLC